MTTELETETLALAGLVGQPGPEDKPLELKLNRHERRKFLKMVTQEKKRVEKRTKRMEVK